MPKIKNVEFIVQNEKMRHKVEAVLNYNSDLKFYITLPEKYKATLNLLSDLELKDLSISKYKRTKYASDWMFVVCSPTEDETLPKAKKAIEEIVSREVIERDVIIVYFNDRTSRNYSSLNKEHPETGMSYGLCYAIEIKVGDGGKLSYNQRGELNPFNKYDRKEIYLSNSSPFIIIDDTPENRAFLERTYTLFDELKSKLRKHLGNPEELLNLIASNQKLIS